MRKEIREIGEKVLEGEIVGMKEVLASFRDKRA